MYTTAANRMKSQVSTLHDIAGTTRLISLPILRPWASSEFLNLCRPSLIMVTSPYKWNVYEWNKKEHLVCVLTDFLVCWALSTQPFFLFENNTEWFYVANYWKRSLQIIISISNILFSYQHIGWSVTIIILTLIKSYRP